MDVVTWSTLHPLDLEAANARYTRWGSDPVNVVHCGGYHRVTTAGSAYRARQIGPRSVEIAVSAGDPADVVADLHHRLAEDLARPGGNGTVHPVVTTQHERMPGYRPPLVQDPFEAVVTAITAQQVNLRWATTTRRRLVERFGTRHHIDGVEVWAFPRPEPLARADVADLRGLQLTTAKSEFIIGVARAAASGHFDEVLALPNDEVIDHVKQLRGVGRWTAEWLLARCLGRGDAVAAGDLGVRKAVSRWVLRSPKLADESEVRAAVAEWGDGANWSVHLLLEKLAAGE